MLHNVMFTFNLPANLENHSLTQQYRLSALPHPHSPFILREADDMSAFTDTIRYCLKKPQDPAQMQNIRQKVLKKSIKTVAISS